MIQKKTFPQVDPHNRYAIGASDDPDNDESLYVLDIDGNPVAIINVFRHQSGAVTIDVCTGMRGAVPLELRLTGYEDGRRIDYTGEGPVTGYATTAVVLMPTEEASNV